MVKIVELFKKMLNTVKKIFEKEVIKQNGC